MPYKCQTELEIRAKDFIAKLTDANIPVEPVPAMFRDYMVKLSILAEGYIHIYYSPKKQTYSLTCQEVRNPELVTHIKACWDTHYEADIPAAGISAPNTQYQAYVDGSYIEGRVGYGAIILHNGLECARFSGAVIDHNNQRQVIGELEATLTVLRWCQDNHVTAIDIYYDYEGIARWATGVWKANNPITQGYQRTVQALPIQISWHKVKSHSGNRWNNLADQLAKQGALNAG